MKVVFLFAAMPHYLVALLNLLNKVAQLEIVVILPSSKSKAVGQSVYEADKNALFKIIRTEESNLSIFKKPYFKNLNEMKLVLDVRNNYLFKL